MLAPTDQAHFCLDHAGATHDLQVLAFCGREAINQPYRFDLELVSERPDLDLERLRHQLAFLTCAPDGLLERTVQQLSVPPHDDLIPHLTAIFDRDNKGQDAIYETLRSSYDDSRVITDEPGQGQPRRHCRQGETMPDFTDIARGDRLWYWLGETRD